MKTILVLFFCICLAEACTDTEELKQTIRRKIGLGAPFGDGDTWLTVDLQKLNYKNHALHYEANVVYNFNYAQLKFDYMNPCEKVVIIETENDVIPKIRAVDNVEFVEKHTTLRSNGNVTIKNKIRGTKACQSEDMFPFGATVCQIRFPVPEGAHLNWADFYVTDSEELLASSFDVKTNTTVEGHVMALDVTFHHDLSQVFRTYFLPPLLYIFISWLSLFLGPMVITRALFVLGSFILVQLHFNKESDFQDEHVLGCWKMVCIVFNFLVLLELVFVSCMASLGRSRVGRCCRKKNAGKYEMDALYEELNDLRSGRQRRTCTCCRMSALVIDVMTAVSLALLLAILAVVYFHRHQARHIYDDHILPHIPFRNDSSSVETVSEPSF